MVSQEILVESYIFPLKVLINLGSYILFINILFYVSILMEGDDGFVLIGKQLFFVLIKYINK